MRRSERTTAGRLGGGESAKVTPSFFQFRLVDRLQCQQSGTVKYTTQPADNMLSLQVGVLSLYYLCCRSVDVQTCRVVSLSPLSGEEACDLMLTYAYQAYKNNLSFPKRQHFID